MDLDRLTEFVTIATRGSMKEAAQILGIAPNVLSTRLKSFENSIHTVLLERSSHGIQLTDSGRLLLDNSSDIISSYQTMRRSILEMKEDLSLTLTFQISGHSMAPEIGIFLDAYNRRHSQITISLLGDNSYPLIDGITTGNVDFFVVYSLEPALHSPFESFCFYHTRQLSVYVSNDHPLASRRHVSFSDLDGECFILYPKTTENSMHENQLSCLQRSGIHYTLYEGRSDAEFYRLLVPIGKGIAINPLIDLAPPNSTVLQLTDPGYEFFAHLVYDPNSANPAVLHFVEEFKEFLRSDHS